MIHDECNFGTCLKCCELLDVDICDHAHFGSQLQVKLSGECHRAHVTWHVWHVFHQVLFTCQDWDTCHCHNSTFYTSQFFRPTNYFPPRDCSDMTHLDLPDTSLQSIFAPLLATQSELHRLAEIESQLAELEDYLDDSNLGVALPNNLRACTINWPLWSTIWNCSSPSSLSEPRTNFEITFANGTEFPCGLAFLLRDFLQYFVHRRLAWLSGLP